jgi:hypothetical protein
MPLVCEELAPETVAALNRKIFALGDDHPLKRESTDCDMVVSRIEDVAVYKSKAGFYFTRVSHNLESTIMSEIRGKREYLCTMFVVDEHEPESHDRPVLTGDEAVQKLKERFLESHGLRLYNQIDFFDFYDRGARLLLVKLPSSVLRHMLAPTGGVLTTIFSGPLEKLSELPTLVKVVTTMPERDGQRAAIVTQYGEGLYYKAAQIHWDIVKEVMRKPNSGIYIGPIAVWDS